MDLEKLRVNGKRLQSTLEEMSKIGGTAGGGVQRLTLSDEDQSQYQEMVEHVTRHAPLEACGLLAEKSDRVEKVLLVRNQAQSPVRFVMDPYEQLQAFEWIDSQGLDLVGIFHSHPRGPDSVSATVIGEAAYEVVHIILSQLDGSWKMRGFWIQDNQVQEVALLIQET